MPKYGFYSAKAERAHGSLRFETPDGREVIATATSDDPGGGDYLWDDKVSVGPVSHCIGTALDTPARNNFSSDHEQFERVARGVSALYEEGVGPKFEKGKGITAYFEEDK